MSTLCTCLCPHVYSVSLLISDLKIWPQVPALVAFWLRSYRIPRHFCLVTSASRLSTANPARSVPFPGAYLLTRPMRTRVSLTFAKIDTCSTVSHLANRYFVCVVVFDWLIGSGGKTASTCENLAGAFPASAQSATDKLII